ncbi:MAG: NAD(P)H-dependent glycerol-3-phosphate dehydrogenase [Pseudomonadales bacterium]|nr:NAD(P)H-dependent glycerol-3-phosphate dehydrogenase [Halioglobus sp.]MCP5131888.1 NAD(P)H-dependent glycerol-3-phosphate dehydrogenase [Pseudomonadales bacterium]
MPDTCTVAVLGGGSFGTVIANIIAGNGHRVRLWLRNEERASAINTQRQNAEYLPGYHLHDKLEATACLARAVAGVDVLFVAVPSSSFRAVVRELAEHVSSAALVISLTKGIEPGGFRLMSEILAEEMPDNARGVLSGPNLAREIAAGHITGSVIASDDPAINSRIHDLLHSESFLIYSSRDMYGVELGGALKNVYAILAGIGAALELGENTVGMLLTRSLAEMSRFAVDLGANPMTFLGLAGVGDLFVTCSSPLSRNYMVGLALGRGQPLDDILGAMDQVAEGINTLGLLKAEADSRGVHMPLVDGLYAILYEHRPVADVFDGMMHAEEAQDVEFVTGR